MVIARTFEQLNIPKLNFHRLSLMKLQRQNAVRGPLRFAIVSYIDRLPGINEMLKVISMGSDEILIPIILFDYGLQFFRTAHRSQHAFHAIAVPKNTFTPSGHNAALHALLIQNASVSW